MTQAQPRRSSFWFSGFILPWIVCAIYVICLQFIEPDDLQWFHSEVGPVELVSALLFLPMAVFAAWVAFALHRHGSTGITPESASGPMWPATTWFALFALGSIFMFLEETSFGQHVIGFESPEFFKEHNKQHELSLHNLAGDAPSSTLRQIANIGLPIFAIVMPFIALKVREKLTKKPDSKNPLPTWYWVITPGWEVVMWVVLAMLVSPIRKLGGFSDDDAGVWRGSLSEFKELLWYGGLLVYAWASFCRYAWRRSADSSGDGDANAAPSDPQEPQQPAESA